MCRIISFVDINPTVSFLTLYDLFLSWLELKSKKRGQRNIINYIKDNFKEFEVICSKGCISYNKKKKCDEDMFTKLRNDISHSSERLNEKDIELISKEIKKKIKKLVSVMSYYLKTTKMDIN